MDQLLEILQDIRPDAEFAGQEHLVTDGILKSFDMMMLIGEIADEFDVEIPVEKVVPENFESVERIWALIESLR